MKSKHGGPRPNSGRRPNQDRKRPVSLRLSLDVIEYLSTVENKTTAIEDAIRKSKSFRDWKKI